VYATFFFFQTLDASFYIKLVHSRSFSEAARTFLSSATDRVVQSELCDEAANQTTTARRRIGFYGPTRVLTATRHPPPHDTRTHLSHPATPPQPLFAVQARGAKPEVASRCFGGTLFPKFPVINTRSFSQSKRQPTTTSLHHLHYAA